jgi:hypothetical protein
LGGVFLEVGAISSVTKDFIDAQVSLMVWELAAAGNVMKGRMIL